MFETRVPLVGAFGAVVVVFLAPVPAHAFTATATVVKIVDGDTVKVRLSDGGGDDTVRVLGIDTPETKDPRKPVECGGPEATTFATNELRGRVVTLGTDPTQDERDRYQRLLAFIDRDGWNYSVEAARAGVARAYVYHDTPVTIYPQIRAAEQQAQAAHRGIWGPPCNGGR